jgi:hypothetical protein
MNGLFSYETEALPQNHTPPTLLKSTSKRGGGGLIECSSIQPCMWRDLLEPKCVGEGGKSDWKSLSEKPQMWKVTSMD